MFTKDGLKRLGKFLVTGGTAAFVEYVVFLLLHAAGVLLLLSNSISFLCGFVVSFLLNRSWVFSSKERPIKQLALYSVLAFINFLISNGLLWLFVERMGLASYIAKIIVMGMIASWNYLLFSRIIFKNKT